MDLAVTAEPEGVNANRLHHCAPASDGCAVRVQHRGPVAQDGDVRCRAAHVGYHDVAAHNTPSAFGPCTLGS